MKRVRVLTDESAAAERTRVLGQGRAEAMQWAAEMQSQSGR